MYFNDFHHVKCVIILIQSKTPFLITTHLLEDGPAPWRPPSGAQVFRAAP